MKKSTLNHELPIKVTIDLLTDPDSSVEILSKNLHESNLFIEKAEKYLTLLNEGELTESMHLEISRFLEQCAAKKNELFARRIDFTRAVSAIPKYFVQLENRLSAGDPETSPGKLRVCVTDLLQQKHEEQQTKLQRLQKNHLVSLRRIQKRTDINDAEKLRLQALKNERLLQQTVKAQEERILMILQPVVTSPDGYLDLFKFYWEEQGKMLTEKEMQRLFHPMMMFAKKQAAKGVLIKSAGINYEQIPVV